MMPASDSQCLAYKYLQGDRFYKECVTEGQQQSYVDLRHANSDAPEATEDTDDESVDDDGSASKTTPKREIILEGPKRERSNDAVRSSSKRQMRTTDPHVEFSSAELRAPVLEEVERDTSLFQKFDEDLARTELRARNRTRSPAKERTSSSSSASDQRLIEEWNRTGTIGRGRGILERKEDISEALLCFLGEGRLNVPMAAAYRTEYFQSTNEKKANLERR